MPTEQAHENPDGNHYRSGALDGGEQARLAGKDWVVLKLLTLRRDVER